MEIRHKAGGKPGPQKPSRAELYYRSLHYITQSHEKQKTYRRFSGMIFLGGAVQTQVSANKPVASEKIPQNRKKAKKNVILLTRNPRFSAKEGLFWAVFGCPTIFNLQVPFRVQLAMSAKLSVFPKKEWKYHSRERLEFCIGRCDCLHCMATLTGDEQVLLFLLRGNCGGRKIGPPICRANFWSFPETSPSTPSKRWDEW